jgi:hypothetical protein
MSSHKYSKSDPGICRGVNIMQSPTPASEDPYEEAIPPNSSSASRENIEKEGSLPMEPSSRPQTPESRPTSSFSGNSVYDAQSNISSDHDNQQGNPSTPRPAPSDHVSTTQLLSTTTPSAAVSTTNDANLATADTEAPTPSDSLSPAGNAIRPEMIPLPQTPATAINRDAANRTEIALPQTPSTAINRRPATYPDPESIRYILRRPSTPSSASGLDIASLNKPNTSPFSPQNSAKYDPSPLASKKEQVPRMGDLMAKPSPPGLLSQLGAQGGSSPGTEEGGLAPGGRGRLGANADQSPTSSMNQRGQHHPVAGSSDTVQGPNATVEESITAVETPTKTTAQTHPNEGPNPTQESKKIIRDPSKPWETTGTATTPRKPPLGIHWTSLDEARNSPKNNKTGKWGRH